MRKKEKRKNSRENRSTKPEKTVKRKPKKPANKPLKPGGTKKQNMLVSNWASPLQILGKEE
jgi:hypothetical protein